MWGQEHFGQYGRFFGLSINMSTECEGTKVIAAGSANDTGHVEGSQRLKAV